MLAVPLLGWVGAWVVQPVTSRADITAVAGLCVDEFEQLPLPLLPLPGWQAKARDDAVTKWAESRETLLAGAQPHCLLQAVRNEDEAGRYFEGVESSLLGFAELGLLPAPPEKKPETAAAAAASGSSPTDAGEGDDSDLYPYLANLAVQAGARRLGIGVGLLRATEQKAVELGYERMYVKVDRENFDARRLYDREGYRLVYLQNRPGARDSKPRQFLFLRKDAIGPS